MFMNATILSAHVSAFYDVDVNLFDGDEEQSYKGQIVEGLPGLDALVKLKRQSMKSGNVSQEALAAAASQVAMPPVMQPVSLRVLRVKTNKAGFMTLMCGLMGQAE